MHFFRTNCYLLTYYKTYLHENTHIVCRGPEMPKLFIRHNNMRTSRYWRCNEQCLALGIRPFIRQIRAFIKIYKLKICMVAGLWDHINFIFVRQFCVKYEPAVPVGGPRTQRERGQAEGQHHTSEDICPTYASFACDEVKSKKYIYTPVMWMECTHVNIAGCKARYIKMRYEKNMACK